MTGGGNNISTKEITGLKSENAKLRAEVETWKSKLAAAEAANGKKLFRKIFNEQNNPLCNLIF